MCVQLAAIEDEDELQRNVQDVLNVFRYFMLGFCAALHATACAHDQAVLTRPLHLLLCLFGPCVGRLRLQFESKFRVRALDAHYT